MVLGINQRRIKRREIWPPIIVPAFEGAECGVDTEASEENDDGKKLEPPSVASLRFAKLRRMTWDRRGSHEFTVLPRTRLMRKL